ncbi:spore germination protein [Paenibacillus tyrfis]|uniref:spore germination protein n=1 Tax=Paenibacillus tyrfis TaxID=1501230 RepID=UPI0020A01FBF|nr:spore germination protein [Paenibacillus tyrfis]MCP1307882.1 spore germination protein [Paenibacillus tyrfis]
METALKPSNDASTEASLRIQQALRECADVVVQPVHACGTVSCTWIYISSIVDHQVLQSEIVALLRPRPEPVTSERLFSLLCEGSLLSVPVTVTEDESAAVQALLHGSAVLLIHGRRELCLVPVKKYTSRAVTEPKNENVIVGPQEAFIENLDANLSLLRHIIKHPSLKIERHILGEYTQTAVCIVYIEGLLKPGLLKHVREKLDGIKLDGILGINYLAEHLESAPYSPFPQIQFTERPDTLAAALLEGRIGVIADGTPVTLVAPVTFFSLMQSAEDYFQRYFAATWIRWIRYFFTVISFLLPSTYVAVTTFHPEMIPANLLTTIAASRENIPFPALVEALMMEIAFEGLREAGIRIPRPIGQTVSIIGAIVIGQAAVQAGIVSAPMVIVVSMTGIASFIIPHFELGLSFRLLRFPIMLLGGALGLFGVIIGVFLIYWHLVTLHSFGVPYMQPFAPLVFSQWKDAMVRAPWTKLKNGPAGYSKKQR